MTSLVDSGAQFESRLLELGLAQVSIDAIKNHGVATLSQLAFALGQPGQPLADGAVGNFLQAALGRVATLQETSILKRAAFEEQTFLIATLRQSVEKTDDQPRKIAFAERNQRMEAIRQALVGVSISGEHEPAHCLLDRMCAMYEQNSIKYPDLSQCIARSTEIQGETKSKELTLEKGSLVVKSSDDKLHSPTDSEIKVHYALIRRGIALQFAKLISFAQHAEWETFLFEALHRDPPPGYSRPSLAQLLQCDKAAWSRLHSVVTDIRQAADGTYPLGLALLNMRQDPHIALYVAPVAKAQTSTSSSTWRAHPYQSSPQQPQGKSKGKGKGKKQSKGPATPQELRGKWHKTPAGDAICFAYNCKSGCSDTSTQPGGRCPRGLHVCAEPRCQKPHSLQQHHAAGGV